MFKAFIVTVLVEAFSTGSPKIQCDFPGVDAAEKPIRVLLEPRPSLKDQPGLFRVIMDLNGKMSLKAAAQPILSTEDRDILIRGITKKQSMYTIGLRDDGKAALNMQTRPLGGGEARKSTRLGECHGHEAHLEKWLQS